MCWKQIDHQVGCRIQQPQIIAECQLVEGSPKCIKINIRPACQHCEKHRCQYRRFHIIDTKNRQHSTFQAYRHVHQRKHKQNDRYISQHHGKPVQVAYIDHMGGFSRIESLGFRPLNRYGDINIVPAVLQIIQQCIRCLVEILLRHP